MDDLLSLNLISHVPLKKTTGNRKDTTAMDKKKNPPIGFIEGLF